MQTIPVFLSLFSKCNCLNDFIIHKLTVLNIWKPNLIDFQSEQNLSPIHPLSSTFQSQDKNSSSSFHRSKSPDSAEILEAARRQPRNSWERQSYHFTSRQKLLLISLDATTQMSQRFTTASTCVSIQLTVQL